MDEFLQEGSTVGDVNRVYLEVSKDYLVITDGDMMVSFHKTDDGYVFCAGEDYHAEINIHQLYNIAAWTLEQVEPYLEKD